MLSLEVSILIIVQRRAEQARIAEQRKLAEDRSYKSVMVENKMHSNAEMPTNYEDDFM